MTFNEIVDATHEYYEGHKNTVNLKQIKEIIDRIKELDGEGNEKLKNARWYQKILTWFRRFPNLFYDKYAVLENIEAEVAKKLAEQDLQI